MAKLTQAQLLEIFNALKSELKPYEKDNIKARFDMQGKYDLWSEKAGIMVQGKLRSELAFAALIVQSSYVGFYFMPIYCNTEGMRGKLTPEFMACLKGKACFHIKSADAATLKNVRSAMKAGYQAYKSNGWV